MPRRRGERVSRCHRRQRGRAQGCTLQGTSPVTRRLLGFLLSSSFVFTAPLSRQSLECPWASWAPGDFSGAGCASENGRTSAGRTWAWQGEGERQSVEGSPRTGAILRERLGERLVEVAGRPPGLLMVGDAAPEPSPEASGKTPRPGCSELGRTDPPGHWGLP